MLETDLQLIKKDEISYDISLGGMWVIYVGKMEFWEVLW